MNLFREWYFRQFVLGLIVLLLRHGGFPLILMVSKYYRRLEEKQN